jgi:hypothetical protein
MSANPSAVTRSAAPFAAIYPALLCRVISDRGALTSEESDYNAGAVSESPDIVF